MYLVPVSVAELELVLRLEEGGDGTPPVVHSELNGSVHHLHMSTNIFYIHPNLFKCDPSWHQGCGSGPLFFTGSGSSISEFKNLFLIFFMELTDSIRFLCMLIFTWKIEEVTKIPTYQTLLKKLKSQGRILIRWKFPDPEKRSWSATVMKIFLYYRGRHFFERERNLGGNFGMYDTSLNYFWCTVPVGTVPS